MENNSQFSNNDYMNPEMETEAERLGKNISKIRKFRKMTQEDLGSMVGLNSNRIEQYEIGYRMPRKDLLNEIAKALDVNPMVLNEPSLYNSIAAMHILFKMEREYGLKAERINEKIAFHLNIDQSHELYAFISEWIKKREEIEQDIFHAEDPNEKGRLHDVYIDWEIRFPESLPEYVSALDKTIRRDYIKSRIKELQQELEMLSDE